MTRPVILFVDNLKATVDSYSRYLRNKRFTVIPADSAKEASRILKTVEVDLVVVDLRLEDDTDETDTSGLKFAKENAPGVPKIIHSAFPTFTAMQEALTPQEREERPLAVNFVHKKQGPEALLKAIRQALDIRPRYDEVTEDTVADIENDYKDARTEARIYFFVSLAVSIAAIVLIFIELGQAGQDLSAIIAVRAGAVVLVNTVVYLFFRQMMNAARERTSTYHQEHLETRRLDTLIAACDELTTLDARDECRQSALERAAAHWFPSPSSGQSLPNKSGSPPNIPEDEG